LPEKRLKTHKNVSDLMRARQNTHLPPAGAATPFVIPTKPGELEERMRGVLRRKQYAVSTEATYVGWYKDFVRWHKPLKPWEMGAAHIYTELAKAMRGEITSPLDDFYKKRRKAEGWGRR
jgi:hypothetical protein